MITTGTFAGTKRAMTLLRVKSDGTFINAADGADVPLKTRYQELLAKKKREEDTAREQTIQQINRDIAANGPGMSFSLQFFKTIFRYHFP